MHIAASHFWSDPEVYKPRKAFESLKAIVTLKSVFEMHFSASYGYIYLVFSISTTRIQLLLHFKRVYTLIRLYTVYEKILYIILSKFIAQC